MSINLEHQFQIKEIQLWMLLYGLGEKNGKVIPYPSAEYVHRNLLSSQQRKPFYLNVSQKFERNPAFKGDKTWELLAHWYIEGLAVEGYEENSPNPLENATVKAKDLIHFLGKSQYASPDWLVSVPELTNTPHGIGTTERNTLHRMILGMAIEKYGYDPEARRNVATGGNNGSICADLDKAGLAVDADTIREHLKAAVASTPPDIPR